MRVLRTNSSTFSLYLKTFEMLDLSFESFKCSPGSGSLLIHNNSFSDYLSEAIMKIVVKNRGGANVLPDGILLSDSVRDCEPHRCICLINFGIDIRIYASK
jgi:hypothetical protein